MISRRRRWVGIGALGFALAFGSSPVVSVATAGADPGSPEDPAAQALTEAAAAVPIPAPSAPTPAAVSGQAAPPTEVSHLPSPQSLPPGTTQVAPEQQSLGYLRDIWHAVRSDDVTMKDALLLLAQHPMSTPATVQRPGESPAPTDPAPTASADPAPSP